MHRQRPFALALALAAWALSAPAARADAASPTAAAREKKADAERAGFVTARSKANATGLVLRYEAPTNLRAGQPALLRLQLSGMRSADATLELRAENPLVRLTLDGQPVAGPIALGSGPVRTLALQAEVPAGLGTQYVSALLTQGGRQAVTSIPLRAEGGAVRLKPEGMPLSTPSGERVISLPAQR